MALQVLYEVDLTGHPWRPSLERHAASVRASQKVVALAEAYISGVLEALPDMDRLIAKHAPMWPVAQLSAVDRNLLRLGLFEVRPGSSTPPKVAINEAVELAKEYGGEQSPRFINGVLGAALDSREQAEQPKQTRKL